MDTESYKLGEELDSFNSEEVQNGILAILNKGCNAVLDMTDCNYISSTGLRVLLFTKKVAASKGLSSPAFCSSSVKVTLPPCSV